ncbi:MAG: NUDIX hydrolase [Candidatus Paceibacterota bacterium]|jgi:8-oxo-dGTP diphosphatase
MSEEKKDHPWVGVDAIIVNNDGKIFLQKRSTSMRAFPDYWGLVGGWMEWDETVEEALKREAQEEVGVEIEVIKFIGKYYDPKGRHPTKTSIALPHICKIVSGEPKVNQISEVQDIGWFTPEEVSKMDLAYDHKQMLKDAGIIK